MNPSIPSPLVFEIAVEPRSPADAGQLAVALQKMTAEDEGFEAVVDAESGQAILKGTDEYQLDAKIDSLRQTHGIDLSIGTPQVAYRETVTRWIEVDYAYKRVRGGAPEFAKVKIVLEPNARGYGNCFESKVGGETVPETYLRSIETGIQKALTTGVIASFPVTDTKVILVDGAYHDTDSSPAAFETAACAACRDALRGSSRLLEPFMGVEVVAPEAYAGSIRGDLVSRRGVISSIDRQDDKVVVSADVPFANMFGYRNQLRAFSQGHGTFAMRFKEYRLVDSPEDPPPGAAAAMRA